MIATNEILDSLLPLLQPDGPSYMSRRRLRGAEPALLAEWPPIPDSQYLLARLSDTVVLVDPGHVRDLESALLDAGHTPKVLRGDFE